MIEDYSVGDTVPREDLPAAPLGTVIEFDGERWHRNMHGWHPADPGRRGSRQAAAPERARLVRLPAEETVESFKQAFGTIARGAARDHGVNTRAVDRVLEGLGIDQHSPHVGERVCGSDAPLRDSLPEGTILLGGHPDEPDLISVVKVDRHHNWEVLLGAQPLDSAVMRVLVRPDEPDYVPPEPDRTLDLTTFKRRLYKAGLAAKRAEGWCPSYERTVELMGLTPNWYYSPRPLDVASLPADSVVLEHDRGTDRFVIWRITESRGRFPLAESEDHPENGTYVVLREGPGETFQVGTGPLLDLLPVGTTVGVVQDTGDVPTVAWLRLTDGRWGRSPFVETAHRYDSNQMAASQYTVVITLGDPDQTHQFGNTVDTWVGVDHDMTVFCLDGDRWAVKRWDLTLSRWVVQASNDDGEALRYGTKIGEGETVYVPDIQFLDRMPAGTTLRMNESWDAEKIGADWCMNGRRYDPLSRQTVLSYAQQGALRVAKFGEPVVVPEFEGGVTPLAVGSVVQFDSTDYWVCHDGLYQQAARGQVQVWGSFDWAQVQVLTSRAAVVAGPEWSTVSIGEQNIEAVRLDLTPPGTTVVGNSDGARYVRIGDRGWLCLDRHYEYRSSDAFAATNCTVLAVGHPDGSGRTNVAR
jgi:hypothetical protein